MELQNQIQETRIIPIDKLRANLGQIPGLPKNPRWIKDEKFENLKKSMTEDPEYLAYRELIAVPFKDFFVVIAGNMRLRAAKDLGFKTMPVKIIPETTPLEKLKSWTLKDNGSWGEHDLELLKMDWSDMDLPDFGIDLYNHPEKPTEPEPEEDNFEEPEIELIKTDIKPGDLFEIGNHRILCGDSRSEANWAKLLNGKKIDLMVTDPPYNVDYTGKTKDALKIEGDRQGSKSFYQFLLAFHSAAFSHTKPGGAWYVWHADTEGLNFRNAFQDSGLMLKQTLIWVKNTFVMGRQDYQWKHEPCLYGWKPGAAHHFIESRNLTTTTKEPEIDLKKLNKADLLALLEKMLSEVQTSTIEVDKPSRSREHPTMKPILLIAPLIKNSSRQGENVADGFLGSGTTIIAADQMNRLGFGIENDPRYVEVSIQRILKYKPSLRIKRNGVEETKTWINKL
jgi:DNA modification methylase